MGRPNKMRYRADRDSWVTKVGSKLRTLAKGKQNKKAALQAFHELMALRGLGRPATPSMVVLAMFDLFLDSVKRERAPLTYDWYLRHLSSAAEEFGEMPAETVRPFHVTAWLDKHDWGQSTRSGAITAVKRAFAWGKKAGTITTNPIAEMEKPPIAKREAILSPEQIATILETVKDPEFRNFLIVCYDTGCRPSEAMKIEASHLDTIAGTLTMASKTTMRTGRLRVITLTARAAQILSGLAVEHQSGPLLRNSRGNPWTRNATAKRFIALRDKLGFGPEATAESFRHGFATDLLRAGTPTATVSALLGHVDPTMVSKVYSKIHRDAEHLQEVVRRVRPGVSDQDAGTADHPADQTEPAAEIQADDVLNPRQEAPDTAQGKRHTRNA